MKSAISRANLFLLELIGNLVIFVLCAAVCVGLILRAHGLSEQSASLTQAVYLAQSTAEALRSGGQAPAAPDGYEITVEPEQGESGVEKAVITVTRGGEAVYTLSAAWAEVS